MNTDHVYNTAHVYQCLGTLDVMLTVDPRGYGSRDGPVWTAWRSMGVLVALSVATVQQLLEYS